MAKNLRCLAPNPVQMGRLNVGLEKLKIVHKVTLHLSFLARWQPAERVQTTSLFLNKEGDAGRALTFTEMFSFLRSREKGFFKHLIQTIPLFKCHIQACRTQQHFFSPGAVQWTNSLNPTWSWDYAALLLTRTAFRVQLYCQAYYIWVTAKLHDIL